MMWSFSAHGTFRKCPRQWFYKKIYANWRAKDPGRREAHRLSKLVSIPAWRGKVVDRIISEMIVPSVVRRRACSLDEAKKWADQLFATERIQLMDSTDGGFFEVAYGLPCSEERFTAARAEIHTALENLYKIASVWTLLHRAKALIPQRPLSFHQGEISVRVVPDLILFQSTQPPAIVDWKVNAYPMRDYWLQLVTGAIGVTHCNPHRDWPSGAAQHDPRDIELLEVQLLAPDVRVHRIADEDLQEAEDFIAISGTEMRLACGGCEPKDLTAGDFASASDPKTCHTCVFQGLCWGTGP